MADAPFRVLHVNLDQGRGKVMEFGDPAKILGGSGLAAALFQEFGDPRGAWDDPGQPLIFAIGPLTGCFPLMSKTVCAFLSPYHTQYAESHAGGRLALALRFAGLHGLMITGRAPRLSCLTVGSRRIDIYDVNYLQGQDVFMAGKLLRRISRRSMTGHRSILRIGPAGENGSAMACINVDSYRHFGRLGAGAVMGAKNLKAVIAEGDGDLDLPGGKEYVALYKELFTQLTATDMMRKYHDLGTPANLIPLNELKALPWRNLQATTDPGVEGISGERFAEQSLLRQTACSGCPVGCIHIGLLRQQFAKDHEYLYKQVNYDYESVFAQGSMLGLTNASDVLALLDETEKQGLDCMGSGVALAWAVEALERGLITERETLTPLAFGQAEGLLAALGHMGSPPNDFYRALYMGLPAATALHGGEDFACVLGQEMAGYATGEVFFTAQSLGFRHSHLDTGGYSYDQKSKDKDPDKAVAFLLDDENGRVQLTSMVSCLFARSAYSESRLQEALSAVGLRETADALAEAGGAMRRLRWRLKVASGFDPRTVKIPKRFKEITTWKGPIDPEYLEAVRSRYAEAIMDMALQGD